MSSRWKFSAASMNGSSARSSARRDAASPSRKSPKSAKPAASITPRAISWITSSSRPPENCWMQIATESIDGLKGFCRPDGKLRLLDPACGSGSFLIRAYERVCEHWESWLTSRLPAKADAAAPVDWERHCKSRSGRGSKPGEPKTRAPRGSFAIGNSAGSMKRRVIFISPSPQAPNPHAKHLWGGFGRRRRGSHPTLALPQDAGA